MPRQRSLRCMARFTHLYYGFRSLQMRRSAMFSPCQRYRYRLSRRWGTGPRVTFVMLNPSTADAVHDDPTIRRCIGFAEREGFGALDVVNLFAGRATRPEDLFAMTDPIGPQNIDMLVRQFRLRIPLIAAWGAHPRAQQVYSALSQTLRFPDMLCLGRSKAGAPRHPLYVSGTQALIPWPG